MIIDNPPQHLPKSIKIIGYKPKEPSLLRRHVEWLKADHGKFNFLKTILKIVEIIFTALSIVCIPLLIKSYRISSVMDAEKKFKAAVDRQPRPDPHIEVELKSGTHTFTHTHELIIHNDFLWSRPRHSGNAWTPMYFDGFKNNKKPVFLHADGANLIALDEDRKVHYRKLIREYRSEEITAKNKRAQEFIKGTDVDLNKDHYIVVDKVEKNNWKEQWFSIPVISPPCKAI